MRYLAISTWAVGPHNPVDTDLARRFVNTVYSLGMTDPDNVGVLMLGSMLDPGDIEPGAALGLYEWSTLVGPDGFLRRLAERVPTVYIPGGCDDFMYSASGTAVKEAIAPIVVPMNQVYYVPEMPEGARDPQFAATHGWQASVWLPPYYDTSKESWLFRHLTRSAESLRAPANLQAELAAARLRQECAKDLKNGLLGVIHGGTVTYWGRFGELWAGSPGGSGYALLLDTDNPALSQLVRLA